MNNLTKGVAALLIAGTASAFGATKEIVASSDVTFGNSQAKTDASLYEADSDKFAVIHFTC